VQQVFPAVEVQYGSADEYADGLVNCQVDQGERRFQDKMKENKNKEGDLSAQVAGEHSFEIEMRLLDGLKMRKKDHAEHSGDKPAQHVGKGDACVEQGAQLLRKEKDEQYKKEGQRKIDQ